MKIAIILLVSIFIFIPCWSHQRHKKHHKSQNPKVLAVAMTRTGCYGRCPGYEVKANADGTIIYTGLKFVDDTGKYYKKRTAAYIAPIIDEVITYRMDTCAKFYRTRVPDLPGFNITITYADSTKVIREAGGGPFYLNKLADELEKSGKRTDTAGWQKMKE